MNNIIRTAKSTIRKFSTNDPFELCDYLDVCLTITALPSCINGFYSNILGMPFIYLNDSLCLCEQRAVLAHELGHLLLHPNINSLYIKTKTIINAGKLEHEADLFAVSLLIPNAIPISDQVMTVEQLAFELDVPARLLKLKFG